MPTKKAPRQKAANQPPRFFNSTPNIIATQILLGDLASTRSREARYREFQAQLRIAVNAFELAKVSIGQAVMALLEVQKALLPVVAEDVFLCVMLHGKSEDEFKRAYSILEPAFTELPKIALLFDGDLNNAFFRSTEENGVEFNHEKFIAEISASQKGGAA